MERSMTIGDTGFNYLRKVDTAAIAALGVGERLSQPLAGRQAGTESCSVHHVCTPPGGGSPAGVHVHDVDQLVYILDGTMEFDLNGVDFTGGAGDLVVIPAGVVHRHWNVGEERSLHLVINAPAPDLDKPLSRPVETSRTVEQP
jgi:quercetin dioxygenase-like cupin family protein